MRKFLSNVSYFQNADDSLLGELALHCQLLQFDKKAVLFSEGDIATGLWVVVKGYILLERRIEDLSVPQAIVTRGTLLNYDRLASTLKPSEVTARAGSFVTCGFLPFRVIRKIAEQNTSMGERMAREQRSIMENEMRPYVLDYIFTL